MQFAVERGEMIRFLLLLETVVVAAIVGSVAVIVAAASSFSHNSHLLKCWFTPICCS